MGSGLATHDLHALDAACTLITHAFGRPAYLVGSAFDAAAWRDVDVRLILPDDEFDGLFPPGECGTRRWELLSLAIGAYLRERTVLPVDFQIQRQTEANERHNTPRNPLGIESARRFAGLGDATPFHPDGNDTRVDVPTVAELTGIDPEREENEL